MLEFPDFCKKMFYLSYSVYILRYSSSMTSLDCQSKKNVKKRSKLPQLTVEEELEALIGTLIVRTQMMQLMVASLAIDGH